MTIRDGVSADFLNILRAERRDLLRRLRETRFSTLKEGYSQSQIIPFSSYSPWLDDVEFMKVHKTVAGHTLVDVYRCYELYTLAQQACKVPGDLMEVGVWRGGTAAVLGAGARGKALHLFDTFTGVAKADDEHDTIYVGGEHADTSTEVVEQLLSAAAVNAAIHVGLFPDETAEAMPRKIALAHIDIDTYRSAKECFAAVWPRVLPGGVVVFDDYGFFGCEGVTQAVSEIRSALTGAVFVHNLNGHGIVVKIA